MLISRKVVIVLTGGLLGIAASVGPASAASPSQEQCEAQGGTFSRDGGKVTCTTTETGKNPKFTEENQTSGQGNTGNKTEEEQSCDPTGHCPPGQFPG
jgi:hypothetical protein